jgi:hypothetical protein
MNALSKRFWIRFTLLYLLIFTVWGSVVGLGYDDFQPNVLLKALFWLTALAVPAVVAGFIAYFWTRPTAPTENLK